MMFHIAEAIRAQVLSGSAEGCLDPHGAEVRMIQHNQA